MSVIAGRCAVALFFALVAAGCTDATLQPPPGPENGKVDNLLTIQGQVCTSGMDDQVFPVKVMFIVDTSGSMQFTDPSDKAVQAKVSCTRQCATTSLSQPECDALCSNANNPGRRQAVEKVIERFRNNPAVSFSIIAFNGRIQVNGGGDDAPHFTNRETDLNAALGTLLEAEITTDYQGALSRAYLELEQDMLETDPLQRTRTKYVLIFLSDGAPNPVCKKGCGTCDMAKGRCVDDPTRSCDNHGVCGDTSLATNTAGNLVVIDSWCDLPEDRWCSTWGIGDPDDPDQKEACDKMKTWFPAMEEPCRDYNQPEQILTKVREIIGLGDTYGVADIRLHTAFLFVDGLPKPILDLYYDPNLTAAEQKAGAERLLEKMAKTGGGLYRSFNTGQAIDFLDINYSSVTRPFGITNFLVSNRNVLSSVSTLVVDSDGDGIDDRTEFEAGLGMDPLKADSDGDGYGDKLEYDRRNLGFHPGDPKQPVRPCRDDAKTRDRDGDGLLDCEEAILGTSPKIADSDRDRIPDGVEFQFGSDPLKADAHTDVDFDGKLAGDEIRMHTSPQLNDPQVHAAFKYIYDVREQPPRPDLRRCYDFKVRRVRLLTTKQAAGAGTTGYNEILVYFGEGPAGDPRDYGAFWGACVRAQYVQPSYKYPADGKVILRPSDFKPLPTLHRERQASRLDPNAPDPCRGATLPQ